MLNVSAFIFKIVPRWSVGPISRLFIMDDRFRKQFLQNVMLYVMLNV